ncbi:MAG: PorT family protein [Candidatus Aminicenantes bacterium]|nr:PorT family protein [Candidatus Aminicenantes bacterium]
MKKTRNYATLNQMKKLIASAFFLLLLTQAAPASEIKTIIGMNSSKYLFSSEIDLLNLQQKTGVVTGLGWALNLNKNIKFEIDLLYSQKGTKVSLPYAPNKSISGIYENSTIGFPFFFKYQFKEKATPYAALGPEFVFLLSHHLKITESGDDFDLLDNTKKFLLAFNVLLGYELPIGQWGLFAEIRYNRWLSNFFDHSEAKVKSESFVFLLGGVYYL